LPRSSVSQPTCFKSLGGHLLGAAVVAADEHGGRIAVESLGRNAEAIRDPNKCGVWNMTEYETAPTPMREISQVFFARECQTIEDLRGSLWGDRVDAEEADAPTFDMMPLRERPVVRTADGRAMIIDPRFFVDRATIDIQSQSSGGR
jgi:hypothetical protein